jgi:hypothetical protein
LSKNLLHITIFALSTLLFSLWIFCISSSWNYAQSLRSSDPLWLLKGVSPWLYMIIVGYILLFSIILYCDLKGKLLHLIFIFYVVLVTDATPYFLSTSCRFPDTFSVVQCSTSLPKVLSNSIMLPYPKSFPVPYMLFYIVHSLADINLFLFSRFIFAPLVLVGIFTIWYLFAARFFDPKVAFISAIIAIPSQMIEVSITPNSLGVILVLISLFLCTLKKWNFRLSFLIITLALVLSHAIHPVVLMIFLLFFYFYTNLLKSNILDVDITKICALFVLWLTWMLSGSCFMGTGIIKTVSNILTMENKNLNHVSTYTTGSGNLIAIFSWIQSLTMYKYILYGLVVLILIILNIYIMNFNPFKISKINPLKAPNFIKKYSFLILAVILLFTTLSILLFGGPDTENLISRTLNYSMLCISLHIGYSFNSLNTQFKFSPKVIMIFFIVFLLLIFITYPLYSYSKDSYINFPLSQEVGFNFFENYVSENTSDIKKNYDILAYSKSDYFYQLMHGTNSEIISMERSVIYNNGWYFLRFSKSVS